MAAIPTTGNQSPAGGREMTSPARHDSPSRTDTPSLSARTSVDLRRNGAARSSSPASQNPPPAQRRNRAALRDYYNLKSKGLPNAAQSHALSRTDSATSNASDSTIPSTVPNASNDNADFSPLTVRLDEPSFDADVYIADLLRTSILRDVLRTESALVSEIRSLDGERKALVYDNYSKLIKAVGTIGDMQRGIQKNQSGHKGGLDEVEKLEEKLQNLSEIVKGLGPERSVLPSGGPERREIRRQKELVRWVLDAPVRLVGLLEHGQKSQAEKEWATVQTLLDEWKGVKGVDAVRTECEKVMTDHEEDEGGG